MSLTKTVGKLALLALAPLGGWTGLNFYTYHNVAYEEVDGTRVFQKADGVYSSTRLEINPDGSVGIERFSFFPRGYTDDRGDGKVDRISRHPHLFARGSSTKDVKELYRTKDLGQYPEVFESADQDFREQMERFQPLIEKAYRPRE